MAEFRWQRPIIIVGAPRSGTSLMHQLLRGYPGFASLIKESNFIWERYTHPALYGWKQEAGAPEKVTEADLLRIHGKFARYALPASVWRKLDHYNVLRYQRSPLLSAFLRPAYHAFSSIRTVLTSPGKDAVLVDKAVNNALYLDLVDRVFPDARYIHIVRNPRDTIASMVASWHNPNRFFTFKLPVELKIPDYPYDRWNFAVPPGWEDYVTRPVAEVAAFQWESLQEHALDFLGRCPRDRQLRIRLEDLVSEPRAILQQIAGFLQIEFNEYLQGVASRIPEVNQNPERAQATGTSAIDTAVARTAETARRLGYDDC